MAHISIWATILSCLFAISHANKASSIYKVGSGIADVTGPAADINMVIYIVEFNLIRCLLLT